MEPDILYSQAVHAGNRIYYVDVKKTRGDELYLSITESKRVLRDKCDEREVANVSFEKHKIFLYREDFAQFMDTLKGAMAFIADQQGESMPRNGEKQLRQVADIDELGKEIELNIEF